MNALVLISLLSAGPCLGDGLVREHTCDSVEVNHFYDDNGNLVLNQLVPWVDGQSFGWVKPENASLVRVKGRSRIVVYSKTWGIIVVRGGPVKETWTQFDPERKNPSHKSFFHDLWRH